MFPDELNSNSDDGPASVESAELTRLLNSLETGSPDAAERLFPLVYDQLRGLAGALLAQEPGVGRGGSGHTLQPTALVHEAYLKIAGQRSHGWRGRSQFIGVAAQAMRRILIDHARRKKAEKRAAPGKRVELSEALAVFEERAVDLITLDDSLEELAALDPRKARLVELRFFGGLSVEEAAGALGVPLRTAERDWTMARAWLRERVGVASGGGTPGDERE
jgi:RNA polymerase sigma factor (TIGR02999 family)